MLALIGRLFEELNARGIRYCHWKSNPGLSRALEGIGDLDLLVDPIDWPTFEAVLNGLGFVKTAPSSWQTSAETHHHYFGMDGPTGRLAHVDACDRVVTGGTLLKNHDLPLRDMIFEGRNYAGIVPVPGHAQELIALVLRKTIESASPLEHAYLLRELREVRAELQALADGETRPKVAELVARWLPSLQPSLFERCFAALASGSVVQRWLVGCQLARMLRAYQLRGSAAAEAFRCFAFARRLLARLGWGEQGLAVSPQGALVAFIGPEGSGKSTLVAESGRWLAQALGVRTIHAGKPPASFITGFTRPFLPLLRAVAPRYRTTMFDAKRPPTSESRRGLGFYLYALRCVALAYDRAKLLRKAERMRSSGAIILCDRYPLHGTLPDGVQLDERKLARQGNRLGRAMARMERALYSQVPTPDAVIACQVSLELALQRNLTRSKRGGPEPESLVRLRHSQFSNASLELEAYRVHTDRPLPETLSNVRRLVWDCITRNQSALPLPQPSQDVARSIPVVKGPM